MCEFKIGDVVKCIDLDIEAGRMCIVDVGRDRVSFSLKRTRPADEVNGNGNGE